MMDTVTALNSVFVNGQWATAHWNAEVVDEATGDLVITAVLASDAGGPVVAALRMTSDLVRELSVMAGFGADGPSTNAAHTNARMAERMDALEQNATVMNEAVAFGTIDLLALVDALKQRLVLLEERLAVLEEDGATPGMTPAQYIALRSQWQ